MTIEPYEKILSAYLKDELRVLNAHIAREQKTLAQLLSETYPGVACQDGTVYLFKRKELDYIAGLLQPEEQQAILLPILLEVSAGDDEITVIARSAAEEKLVATILDMPLMKKRGRIKLHKPQLALLRKALRTATEYVFLSQTT